MNVYFDTEFTGLHQHTTLLSIGCIAETGAGFYAEFEDYDKSQVTPWLQNNVMPNLIMTGNQDLRKVISSGLNGLVNPVTVCRGGSEEIKEKLEAWLMDVTTSDRSGGRLPGPVQMVSDCCHYDMVLFLELFGGAQTVPNFISPVCIDINQMIAERLKCSDRAAFNYRREEYVKLVSQDTIKIPEDLGALKHNALWDAWVIKTIYDGIAHKRFS